MQDVNGKTGNLMYGEIARGLGLELSVDFSWQGDTTKFRCQVMLDDEYVADVRNDGNGGDSDIHGVPGKPTSAGAWLRADVALEIENRLRERFGAKREISPGLQIPTTLGLICEEMACEIYNAHCKEGAER